MPLNLDTGIPLAARTADIGGAFMQAFGGARQLRAQQEQQAALAEQRRSLADERQQRTEALQREAQRQERLMKVFSTPNPSREMILAADPSKGGVEIADGLDAIQDRALTRYKTQQEVITKALGGLINLPEPMQAGAYDALRADFLQRQWVKPEQVPEQFDKAFVEAQHRALLSPDKQYDLANPVLSQTDPTKDLTHPRTGAVVRAGTPEVKPETRSLDVQAAAALAKGDMATYTRLLKVKKEMGQADDRPPTVNVFTGQTDPAAIAEGIKNGTMPPDISQYGRAVVGAVASNLAKSGYNLAQAQTDWKATQKHVQTLNGAQQLRLNQAINALPELLDSVDALAGQWKANARLPVLNKLNVEAAKAGAYGQESAALANALETQIADVVGDLGTVYMGGNSPTDHGLQLAGTALKSNWDEKVLHSMVALAKKNVVIRRNSIDNTGVAGASGSNQYAPAPRTTTEPPPPGGGALHKVDEVVLGPDGLKHKIVEVSPDGKQYRLGPVIR